MIHAQPLYHFIQCKSRHCRLWFMHSQLLTKCGQRIKMLFLRFNICTTIIYFKLESNYIRVSISVWHFINKVRARAWIYDFLNFMGSRAPTGCFEMDPLLTNPPNSTGFLKDMEKRVEKKERNYVLRLDHVHVQPLSVCACTTTMVYIQEVPQIINDNMF